MNIIPCGENVFFNMAFLNVTPLKKAIEFLKDTSSEVNMFISNYSVLIERLEPDLSIATVLEIHPHSLVEFETNIGKEDMVFMRVPTMVIQTILKEVKKGTYVRLRKEVGSDDKIFIIPEQKNGITSYYSVSFSTSDIIKIPEETYDITSMAHITTAASSSICSVIKPSGVTKGSYQVMAYRGSIVIEKQTVYSGGTICFGATDLGEPLCCHTMDIKVSRALSKLTPSTEGVAIFYANENQIVFYSMVGDYGLLRIILMASGNDLMISSREPLPMIITSKRNRVKNRSEALPLSPLRKKPLRTKPSRTTDEVSKVDDEVLGS